MALLMVASAVGLAVRWVKVPYSIALVIVGLTMGSCHLLPPVAMTPDLILLICLPALLFEASWNLDVNQLLRDWRAILLLAVPGVIVAMAISAAIMHGLTQLSWPLALLFGAITAATDPISVLALFRRLGVDKRLSLLLEAESLFNDGTAVVLFKLVLAVALAAAAGQTGILFSPGHFAGEFCLSIAGGAGVGLAIGFCSSYVTRFFEDHLLETTLTAIAAYGSYLMAEQLHVSPVLAVLMAGIVVGNYGSRAYMNATTRLAVNAFWEYAAFLVNSIVFLLIGLQIDFPLLVKYGGEIGVGVLAIVAARFLLIYGLGWLIPTKQMPLPFPWRHMLFWGALRGSLSMALALSLPLSFTGREEMIVLTFGVTLFTLLLPGLTIEPLAKILKLSEKSKNFYQYEELKGRLFAETQALNSLDNLLKEGVVGSDLYGRLASEVREKCHSIVREIETLKVSNEAIDKMSLNRTKMHLLEVRKEAVFQLSKMHGAERELVDTLVLEIDTQLEELRNAMDLDQTNDGEQTVAEQKAAPLAETIKSEGSVESGKTL
jgi:CPA1 family monovalent cation:H+ antiporter